MTKPISTIELLKRELKNQIDQRDSASYYIKEYTDDWVIAQKRIIDLQDTLLKLKEK